MLKRMLKGVLYIAVSVLAVTTCSAASDPAFATQKADLAQTRLENIHIRDNSVEALLAHLSLSYNVPIGLELARSGDKRTVYRLNFQQGTLSDLLNQFVTQNNQYAWEIKDGVVNIYPKDEHRDAILNELLTAEIASFSVKEKTGCWALGESLVATPEVRRIVEAHGLTYRTGYIGGFYIQQLGQHFTLDASNEDVRSILNSVVRESPVAKIWIMSRNSADQTFSIRLNARLESIPDSERADQATPNKEK